MFVEQMVQAMTEAAGFAIETGHDDLASDAIQNVTDLETLVSDDGWQLLRRLFSFQDTQRSSLHRDVTAKNAHLCGSWRIASTY